MIRLYDTARREKVPFQPVAPGTVGLYVCGPTVYDMCHVGHARCYVAFDVVVRFLRSQGFSVTYVRNITDVEDKIIRRAAELGEDPLALSRRFSDEFHADMEALSTLKPDVEPRVSDHIPEIIALIGRILEAKHAYVVEGDVYFSVDSFPPYGSLSRRNLDELRAGARVDVDSRKHNPLDFALWKTAKPGEPSWDSPWGPGRPGWHIECSAMSSRYLGDDFDIHGGGMDLIFPHHENEIAQSRSVHGEGSFARFWLHNGFINVRTGENAEEKMSKSLGNFFTIREVLARHEPEALRLYLLGTHYRNPLSFEIQRGADGEVRFTNLEEAEQRLTYAYTTRLRLDEALAGVKPSGPGDVQAPASTFLERFTSALCDDFNSAAALGYTSEILTQANKLLDQPKGMPKDLRRRTLMAVRDGLAHAGSVLGLFSEDPETFLVRHRNRLCARRGLDIGQIEALIASRLEARKSGDFTRSDALREELHAMGLQLMDGPKGTTWRVNE